VALGSGGTPILEQVNLTVGSGEIVGLCGDPSPARAAIIGLLCGTRESRAFTGELSFAGQPLRWKRSEDAQRAGVACVRKPLAVVPELSVAENVMLGMEPKLFGLVDEARLEADARKLIERFGASAWLDVNVAVAELSPSERQIVEIIRCVSQGAKLLLLEDLTLSLSQPERERLFAWLRGLTASSAVSVLFVSQRVDEVFGVCDRVIVLRAGRTAEAQGRPERRDLLGGRYTIGEEIASGGMATVHLGCARGAFGFAKTVAVKRLHPQLSRDPEFVAMFLDEARLSGRVRHPNVVPVLDVFADAGELCLVMEYVEGESLSGLLKGMYGAPLPPAIAVGIVIPVLHGLEAAHQARSENDEPLGLVHRDVSPHNVIVGVDGVARLIDFGVAKAMGRSAVSRHGQLKGKVAYMAPEQIAVKPITPLTDVWGAGVVLWECLTGEVLFQGETEGVILGRVLDERVPPPSELGEAVSAALDAVCLRALSRDPAGRFQSAREMAVALERCVTPASPAEIGAWVEATARANLERRRACVKRAERVF
jgi:ABC-type branched-subunit amino acid transport system ATPase component